MKTFGWIFTWPDGHIEKGFISTSKPRKLVGPCLSSRGIYDLVKGTGFFQVKIEETTYSYFLAEKLEEHAKVLGVGEATVYSFMKKNKIKTQTKIKREQRKDKHPAHSKTNHA